MVRGYDLQNGDDAGAGNETALRFLWTCSECGADEHWAFRTCDECGAKRVSSQYAIDALPTGQDLPAAQDATVTVMDTATYQLMLDDIGELVTLYGLPLGDMMNRSPRNVLLACIEEAKKEHGRLAELEAKNG